jgi:hypothetical protein
MKEATTGKNLEPSRSRQHGQQYEGLCTSINAAGDTTVVGCQNGKVLVSIPLRKRLVYLTEFRYLHAHLSALQVPSGALRLIESWIQIVIIIIITSSTALKLITQSRLSIPKTWN